MELTYSKHGNYYLPNIATEGRNAPIGKYGMIRLDYLKKNHKVIYTSMLMKGTLYNHLREIDEQARKR